MEKTLLENLKRIFFRYRLGFFKAAIMVLASNLLLIGVPLVFRQAVLALDTSLPPEPGPFYSSLKWLLGTSFHALWPWPFLLLGLSVLSASLKYRMRTSFFKISQEVERETRAMLFHKIQNQTRAFFDRHGIGDLLSRLTSDVSAYRDILGPGIMFPLFFTTLMVPGFIALASISPPLTLLSLIPLLTIPFLNYTVNRKIYKISKQVQEGLGEMSNKVQEHYSGIRIVKGYGIEQSACSAFSELCQGLIQWHLKLAFLQGMLFPFFTAITRGVTVLVVLFTGYFIAHAWHLLSAADFVSFMWIQSYIFFPVLMLAWMLPLYGRGQAAYERLVRIYYEPIDLEAAAEDSTLTIPPNADLTLKHLSFRYANTEKDALHDLNLHIQAGTFVGITGPIGAGKSTLFRLLNREYEIPHGMIFINGLDIHEYPLSAIREQMVTVEQLPFLFSTSVANNVRFGREAASTEEVISVAELTDLHETVLAFPEQYETVIGERGVTLSGGQKQRVALARAFLVDRPLHLLDDIFSAVDTVTEKKIFMKMREKLAGKTVLLISHRASILEKMDRIICLRDGHIIEDGSPQELLKAKGYYAALVELQERT